MGISSLVSRTLNRVCLENTILTEENARLKAEAATDRPIEWHMRGIGRAGGISIMSGKQIDLGYDLAGYVKTREDGELIVDLFQGLVKLDYRPSEPNWIQVKVIVDNENQIYILDELITVVMINGDFIRPSQISIFMKRHCLPCTKINRIYNVIV